MIDHPEAHIALATHTKGVGEVSIAAIPNVIEQWVESYISQQPLEIEDGIIKPQKTVLVVVENFDGTKERNKRLSVYLEQGMLPYEAYLRMNYQQNYIDVLTQANSTPVGIPTKEELIKFANIARSTNAIIEFYRQNLREPNTEEFQQCLEERENANPALFVEAQFESMDRIVPLLQAKGLKLKVEFECAPSEEIKNKLSEYMQHYNDRFKVAEQFLLELGDTFISRAQFANGLQSFALMNFMREQYESKSISQTVEEDQDIVAVFTQMGKVHSGFSRMLRAEGLEVHTHYPMQTNENGITRFTYFQQLLRKYTHFYAAELEETGKEYFDLENIQSPSIIPSKRPEVSNVDVWRAVLGMYVGASVDSGELPNTGAESEVDLSNKLIENIESQLPEVNGDEYASFLERIIKDAHKKGFIIEGTKKANLVKALFVEGFFDDIKV